MATPAAYEMHELKHHGLWTFRDAERMRRLNLAATDLGVSFPMTLPSGERQLFFLFGDTHHFGPFNTGRWDEDSIAAAPYAWVDRESVPPLEWLEREDGQWLSLIVPGEDLRGMEVPLDGVQVGADVVLFFNAEYDFAARRHGILVCAVAPQGRFDQLERRFRQATDRFLNISVSPDVEDAETIWIFGTGHYRRSPIYLAKAPARALHDFASWRFFTGSDWVAEESDAASLIEGRIGELSVRYVPAVESWVMMYQRRAELANGHRIGVYMRFSPHPTGPWSDEVAVLEPDARRGIGYTQFMHAHEDYVGFCDGLANPGREKDWGGPYGAYLVPEWSYAAQGRVHVVFTLSSWNPYQVHLLEAVMWGKDEVRRMKDEGGGAVVGGAEFPGFEEWAVSGDEFVLERAKDGQWLVHRDGVARRAVEWTVPAGQRWLDFKIEGGMVARLYDETGHRVRESRGGVEVIRDVRWRVDDYAGQVMVLEIVGRSEAPLPRGRMTEPRLVPTR